MGSPFAPATSSSWPWSHCPFSFPFFFLPDSPRQREEKWKGYCDGDPPCLWQRCYNPGLDSQWSHLSEIQSHGKSDGPEFSSDDSEESRDRPTSILPHPRPHRCWTVKLSRGDAGERDCDSAWRGRKCLRTAFFGERKTVFNNSPLIVSHAAV